MSPALLGANLAAVTLLVFGLYLPRHGRQDLLVAYLGVNIGVFAVAAALTSTEAIGAGLGLGLFGVLSIIRLRSQELSQTEIAYYFAALALGLLAGLGSGQPLWIVLLMALVVGAIFVGDHPKLATGSVSQHIVLDRAHGDPAVLRAHVERVLGGAIHEIAVVKTDLVNDTTLVSVRHTPTRHAPPPHSSGGSSAPATSDTER